MITKLRQGTNSEDIDDDMIVVVDERSLRDDNLLLVGMPEEGDDNEESFSVRVSFALMESHLLLWSAGRTTVFEDRERAAKTNDGVLRSEGSDTGSESISQQSKPSKDKKWQITAWMLLPNLVLRHGASTSPTPRTSSHPSPDASSS
jgi:hypothetical protein